MFSPIRLLFRLRETALTVSQHLRLISPALESENFDQLLEVIRPFCTDLLIEEYGYEKHANWKYANLPFLQFDFRVTLRPISNGQESKFMMVGYGPYCGFLLSRFSLLNNKATEYLTSLYYGKSIGGSRYTALGRKLSKELAKYEGIYLMKDGP